MPGHEIPKQVRDDRNKEDELTLSLRERVSVRVGIFR